ncbi:peptidoglycan-binding protein [Micromonospora carbonacea]|uniref:peptidoglycan-binding domain-containing protein n=1 Tax=Micromonospora carbonacea TaxID=47853 RepID=UPI00371D2658
MSGPYLVPNLATLRTEFNARWPGRDRRSDGWIGDQAHASGTSGHNPDETGRAERQDADTKDEVRALDLDADVDPAPADELFAELDRIRRTPELRRRLIYIIYRRQIASASNGWVWRPYTGSSPHTEHGHLSGHPDYDDDTTPWGVATTTGRFTMFEACKKGDEGEHVKALQVALEHLGYLPSGASDGEYGEQTSGAVLAMRKSTGSSAKSGDVFDAWGHMQLLICVSRKYGSGKAAPFPARLTITGEVTATAPTGAS